VVNNFVDHIDSYTFEALQLTHSPSGIIVEHCARFA
jgi:hypothetical protein